MAKNLITTIQMNLLPSPSETWRWHYKSPESDTKANLY